MGNPREKYTAVLLVGPTGSGKTPLGGALERSEFGGRRWFHFDFGDNLRAAACAPERFPLLKDEDLRIIRHSLETGALLEDDQFFIVASIFKSFIQRKGIAPQDGVVLNGMPRHAGQAAQTADFVNVARVLFLSCDEDTVVSRIMSNAGGDRTHRTDDDLEAVARKCRTFREQTLPLLAYYRSISTDTVIELPVGLETGPHELLEMIRESIGNSL